MRVSAVLVAYNASWCVERALDSLIGQTRRPDQVLVCDDGSTDGTPDLVQDRFGDSVTLLRLPHRNASATRRVGLERAIGDWLAFIDADDTWLPEKLERQLEFIGRHPEVRLVTSDGAFVSPEGVIRESWLSDYFDPVREIVGDLAPLLVERCFPLVSATMVERNAYHEAGGLDPEMTYSHDYDLWLRILARHPGGVVPDRLVRYLSSPGTLSRNVEARKRDDLGLMRRVQRGELEGRRDLGRRAAARAAALEFEIALKCLKTGRHSEARRRMRLAIARGPLKRRALALAGSVMPGWMMTPLMRSERLKGAVAESREPAVHIVAGDGA